MIPNIPNMIRSLNGMRIFSLIDLKYGFFQVPLSKEDLEKTTFLDTNNRLMQFTRMPQGYKNSPAIFQKGMTIILEDLIENNCCYILMIFWYFIKLLKIIKRI
ncbi:Retrovirus-related Pol polyprotein from transposon gypsy [Dictyocoela muelleri]|nr:Retrovirus-related Pol polyprotein from transposon gypsy [Dictyocoela muelleri]